MPIRRSCGSSIIQLTEIEEAFKTLKGDLCLRLIHHQKLERVVSHIFIAFLAYCLRVTLKRTLRDLAPGLTPRSVLATFERQDLLDATLAINMGSNGFSWGEHGLTNKRHAYEESMRIPMLMRCSQIFEAGTVINAMADNIDIPATILEAAGLWMPRHMDGCSLVVLAQGKVSRIRDHLVYEYFWERRNSAPNTTSTSSPNSVANFRTNILLFGRPRLIMRSLCQS